MDVEDDWGVKKGIDAGAKARLEKLTEQVGQNIKTGKLSPDNPHNTIKRTETNNDNPFKTMEQLKGTRGITVLIYGPSGTGKSLMGLSFPKPLMCSDTENGIQPLLKKLDDKNGIFVKVIDIVEDNLYQDTEVEEVKSYKIYLDSVDYIINNIKKDGIKTVMIDSMTDVWSWCQSFCKVNIFKIGVNDRLKAQWDWGVIKNYYYRPLRTLINSGVNVVLVARPQEIYNGAQPTGIYRPHCEGRTEFFVDIVLEMKVAHVKGKPVFYGIIHKCRQNGALQGREVQDITFDKLKRLIDGEDVK